MTRRSDPDCPWCHGAGEVIVSRDPDVDRECGCVARNADIDELQSDADVLRLAVMLRSREYQHMMVEDRYLWSELSTDYDRLAALRDAAMIVAWARDQRAAGVSS